MCWKNLSKRPAVEPSDFWENRDFKNNVFSYFPSLRLRFLYFSYLYRFSVAPSPPSGPDWSHLWSISVPFMFGFGRSWRTTEEKTTSPRSMTFSNTRQPTFDPLLSCLLFPRRPKQPNPQQPPRPTNRKNLVRRNARLRPESAAPSGGTACWTHTTGSDFLKNSNLKFQT